jgi:hypothetical protein
MILTTPEQLSRFQLCAVRGALKLEALGMKSRGGSIRKGWAIRLGLKPSTKHADLIAHITMLLDGGAA